MCQTSKKELREIQENMELVEEFPFLKPIDEGKDYDYSYTYLDDIPDGWKKSFGRQFCQELKDALTDEELSHYYVCQAKEKFGGLRWYDEGGNEKTRDIIDKYEEISLHTCVNCGKEATLYTTGWILPVCDECAKEIKKKNPNEKFRKIK